MSSQPDLFIIRQVPGRTPQGDAINEAVPVRLIAADELPDFLEIDGISRCLNWEDAEGMVNLGTFGPRNESRKWTFRLPQGDCERLGSGLGDEMMQVSPERNVLGGNGSVEGSQASGMNWEPRSPQAIVHSAPASIISPQGRAQSDSSTPQRLSDSQFTYQSPASTIKPTIEGKPGTTVHLSHRPRSTASSSNANGNSVFRCQEWCHHGICSRGLRCTREHSMPHPQDTIGLKQVGLDKLPAWYTGAPKSARVYRQGKANMGKNVVKKVFPGPGKKPRPKNKTMRSVGVAITTPEQRQAVEAACDRGRGEHLDSDEIMREFGVEDESVSIKMEEDEGVYVKIEDDEELIDFR